MGLAIVGIVALAVLMVACGGTEQSVLPSETPQPTPAVATNTPVPATPTPTTGTPTPLASPSLLPTDAPTAPTPLPPPATLTPPAQLEVFVGGTDDITWQVVEILGSTPSAGTMTALGHLVANALVPDEGEGAAQISVVEGPVIGDLGEIALDAVGLADDSILGYRLRIFAHLPDGEGGFTLKTVERTLLCRRGVSGDLCL